MGHLNRISIITGVEFEAAVIRKHFRAAVASRDILVAYSGPGNRNRLNELVKQHLDDGAKGFISFGVAGGLDNTLSPGRLVMPKFVRHEEQSKTFVCHQAWHSRLLGFLAPLGPVIDKGLVTTSSAICSAQDKHRLYQQTGAAAVDMESGFIAAAASAYDLPFLVLRAIADPAGQALPASALAGMDALGHLRAEKSLMALAKRPWELPDLIRLAGHSKTARNTLSRVCDQLPALIQLQP